MTDRQTEIIAILGRLKAAHPIGFATALHIRYSAPKYLFQAYDPAWTDLYSQRGLVLDDPTIRWGLHNTGAVRWSALPLDDRAAEMMRLAAGYGIRHGFTLVNKTLNSRSLSNFSSKDGEASDDQIAQAAMEFAALHRLTQQIDTLTPLFHDKLRSMSIYLTRR